MAVALKHVLTDAEFAKLRDDMIEHSIRARGVRDPLVLEAMAAVPRQDFLPQELREFAYDDTPLPIAAGQTISQPYIVAFMIEAALLKGGEQVLEIGTGSGYAAAVLSQIAGDVYTVERIGQLAEKAAATLEEYGYSNVHVRHGDGTRGWQAHAPYDAIIVAAGGPAIPESLTAQLKIGGRLVIPVGDGERAQELVRITRVSDTEFRREELADVRFVPLIGDEGWQPDNVRPGPAQRRPMPRREEAPEKVIAQAAEPFGAIDATELSPLLARIGEADLVLIGEATHGTSEFYRMRASITRALIERRGFNFVAIEGDWPDAARIDHYVRHRDAKPSEWTAFARFPTWMWRNHEVRDFVDWLHKLNSARRAENRVAFHGLDLYSMHDSIRFILQYLDEVDPETAAVARERYGCLTPWQKDPASYGHAALTGTFQTCEAQVVAALKDLMAKRNAYADKDGERFLDASQNAQLVVNAERYYRTMYYGSRASWNLRDQHMFDTLKTLLKHHRPGAKGVVWAHNSHVGNAGATEMAGRGEFNIGALCRKQFGRNCYLIGFGTDRGTVAAASDWGGALEIMTVRPSQKQSYERLMHESETPRFMFGLRDRTAPHVRALFKPRLERAIGVIYRPDSELSSHYFEAVLPDQFDEYIWFDETQAVSPLKAHEIEGYPDTYPFGL